MPLRVTSLWEFGIGEERKKNMENTDVQFEFDGVPIQSTGDGKIAILDAIYAVTGMDCARTLWQRLTSDHPEVLDYCEPHPFREGGERLVVDGQGWERISMLLIPYLGDGC